MTNFNATISKRQINAIAHSISMEIANDFNALSPEIQNLIVKCANTSASLTMWRLVRTGYLRLVGDDAL